VLERNVIEMGAKGKLRQGDGLPLSNTPFSSAFPVESKALLPSPIRTVRMRKGAVSLSLSHGGSPLLGDPDSNGWPLTPRLSTGEGSNPPWWET